MSVVFYQFAGRGTPHVVTPHVPVATVATPDERTSQPGTARRGVIAADQPSRLALGREAPAPTSPSVRFSDHGVNREHLAQGASGRLEVRSDAALAALVSGTAAPDRAVTGAAEHAYRRGSAGGSTFVESNQPSVSDLRGLAQRLGATSQSGA